MDIQKIKLKLEKDIDELKDPELGYIKAGLPRFAALFGRDSCIASWQLIDYDTTLASKTIEILSKLQGKVTDNLKEDRVKLPGCDKSH